MAQHRDSLGSIYIVRLRGTSLSTNRDITFIQVQTRCEFNIMVLAEVLCKLIYGMTGGGVAERGSGGQESVGVMPYAAERANDESHRWVA